MAAEARSGAKFRRGRLQFDWRSGGDSSTVKRVRLGIEGSYEQRRGGIQGLLWFIAD